MRFKNPVKDEVKYVRKFAFFPKRVEGTKIWLEFYYLKYTAIKANFEYYYYWTDFPTALLSESLPSKLEKAMK